jgi:hypothetical protein
MDAAYRKHENMRRAYRVLVGAETQGKNHLEDLGVDGRIKSTWIFN